jgi:exonuclease SbcD
MRFLHTSDWHLGRSLHGEPQLDAQRDFLTWLLERAVAEQVDAVVVAGDVYDRAVPPLDAVRLLDLTLAEFSAAAVPIILTSGNHDSAIRLGFGGALQERAGVHLRTSLADLTRPVRFSDEHGEVGVYGLPYLVPDAVMAELDVAERSHFAVLNAAMDRVRADAARRGLDRFVVAAHAFITGAVGSESERDIRVGGIGDASARAFDGAAYVALGHLHGAQRVSAIGAVTTARYSGSPLAFSFSERDHVKSVALVDIDAAGAADVSLVPTPVARPLREVRGPLADLLARADDDLVDLATAYVKATLTDTPRPPMAIDQLRRVWPHTLVLEYAATAVGDDASAQDIARISRATDPVEICALFVEWVTHAPPSAAERQVLAEVVEVASARRAQDGEVA